MVNRNFDLPFPSNLVKIMQWVTESNPTERQVRSIAKSMFRKMAGDDKVILKSQIEEHAQVLLSSQSGSAEAGTAKSLQELKSSVKRLLHSALLLSGTNEVGVRVCVRVSVHAYMCVCVHTSVCMYIHLCVHVHVLCVCVCA